MDPISHATPKPSFYSKTFKRLLIIVCIFILAAASVVYWQYSQRYVNTQDAYLNANVVQVATRVTGQVKNLYVVDNQLVKAGQALFDLDQVPFEIAVLKAQAQLAIAEVESKNTHLSSQRILTLVNKKTLSAQAADDAFAKQKSALATIQAAKADLNQAETNLVYTKVTAPNAGWITNMRLQVGNNAIANQPLFALINNAEFWVDANFKETEMEHIQPGQTAVIEVDMYPKHPFKGVVESIGGGTGTAFSLLPAQNATGNWVKVTQRVPVRVRVTNLDPRYPLRIGTTATVTIDTYSSNTRIR